MPGARGGGGSGAPAGDPTVHGGGGGGGGRAAAGAPGDPGEGLSTGRCTAELGGARVSAARLRRSSVADVAQPRGASRGAAAAGTRAVAAEARRGGRERRRWAGRRAGGGGLRLTGGGEGRPRSRLRGAGPALRTVQTCAVRHAGVRGQVRRAWGRERGGEGVGGTWAADFVRWTPRRNSSCKRFRDDGEVQFPHEDSFRAMRDAVMNSMQSVNMCMYVHECMCTRSAAGPGWEQT